MNDVFYFKQYKFINNEVINQISFKKIHKMNIFKFELSKN